MSNIGLENEGGDEGFCFDSRLAVARLGLAITSRQHHLMLHRSGVRILSLPLNS